ncbi:efflux RND transporter periplasmic adaptor subunit [Stieleria sp. JC731]|uniref:efflux RND transporter periplasmic adaptor subunit n=1 Tax=Pirellulaceae TaxID=2691357 RepID=UPI001E5ED89E|nr:efflux RND transporter periplasmic adaptor subunit [Stieleria sp. JC731]MCC9599921.1 efflux RND transporter periplasmic adaptor subunit [Stieleria sp. JC731]
MGLGTGTDPSSTSPSVVPLIPSRTEEDLPTECPVPTWASDLADLLSDHQITAELALVYQPRNDNAPATVSTIASLSGSRTREIVSSNRLGQQLLVACRQSASDGNPRQRRELSHHLDFFAIPIVPGDSYSPVLGLISKACERPEQRKLAVQAVAIRIGQQRLKAEAEGEKQIAEAAAAINELASKALQESSLSSAAQVIVSELSRHLDLPQIFLGYRKSETTGCELLAANDTSQLDQSGQNADLIRNAFDETLLLGHSTVHNASRPTDNGSLESLSRQTNHSVIAIPIAKETEPANAVVVATCNSSEQADFASRFVNAAAPMLCTVLDAVTRKHRRVRFDLFASKLRERQTIIAVGIMALIVAAMFVPVPYRETCDGVVEPEQKRFVAIPFDATLLKCEVNPGDTVKVGQTLAVLEDRQLNWRLESLQADYQKAQKTKDAAQVAHDFAKQRISELDMQKAKLEIELLQHQLHELQIRSPIDGIVIAGDHQRSQGVPVKTGETLFEIAPLDRMTMEFSIDEEDVRNIVIGMNAEIRLDALPNQRWENPIQSISPRSEIRDGQNVFVGECDIPETDIAVRPGMSGRVRIDCGKRPLGWVLFHGPYEAVSQRLW